MANAGPNVVERNGRHFDGRNCPQLIARAAYEYAKALGELVHAENLLGRAVAASLSRSALSASADPFSAEHVRATPEWIAREAAIAKVEKAKEALLLHAGQLGLQCESGTR